MFVWLPRVSPLPNGVQASTSESFWLDLQNPWSSLFLVEHFLCWQPDRCTQIGAYPLLPFTAWRESQDTWFALSCWLEPPVCVSYQLRIPLEEAGRSWGASCLCLERLGALMSWRLQAGGMGDARDIIKSLEELIQRGHAEYLGTLWGWIMCVCTGNSSLISHQITRSILHLPCLLMGTKRAARCLFLVSVCICASVWGHERSETNSSAIPTMCQALTKCLHK